MTWLGWLLRGLAYLWVLRVPILTGLVLTFFPWIALQNGASSYLAGLLDVPDPRAMVLVALVSLLVAWAVMMSGASCSSTAATGSTCRSFTTSSSRSASASG